MFMFFHIDDIYVNTFFYFIYFMSQLVLIIMLYDTFLNTNDHDKD